METDCRDYIDYLSSIVEGRMGFIFANWDNRSPNRNRNFADFERLDVCDEPADSCDDSFSIISDFQIFQWGYNEAQPVIPDDAESEEDNTPEPEPPKFYPLLATSGDEGVGLFWLRGVKNRTLITDDITISMGKNNRAWILDQNYDNEVYWAHYEDYLGGALEFTVNVNNADCYRALGVYIVEVNDGDCSWKSKPSDQIPQCASIDIMEANRYGFNAASHPC